MIYRDIGKTGKKASIIGLGLEQTDRRPYKQMEEMIHAALDHGVNIMDAFMPGREVRENIARALGKRRKDVMIQGHIGSTDLREQYDISRDLPTVQRYFEDMLRLFGGYIDFGMMFFIDSEQAFQEVFETDFIDYVERLKRQGDIGHIGFSSHNPEIAMRVVETGLVEVMMFSINMAFDLYPAEDNVLEELHSGLDAKAFRGIDPMRAELYKLCEQRDVSIHVMKPLGAGKLLSPEHTPFENPLTVPQCLHYALTRPAVATVLPGCETAEEVHDVMRYLSVSDEERDYTPVLGTLRNDFVGQCVYCSHCLPCPVDIDIAAVNKYLDIAELDLDNVPPSVRSHYASMENGAGECIACGSCEDRCPFGVPIIANMAQAAEIFE